MLRSQRRMAAGEDESELVVAHRPALVPVVVGAARCACGSSELFMEFLAPCRTAEAIDRTVSCGGNDPPRRVGRDAAAPPPINGHDERVLNGVFGERDVAEDAYQGCHRLAVHLAEHALNVGRFPMGGDSLVHAFTRPVASNPSRARSYGMGGLRSDGSVRPRPCRPRPGLHRGRPR